MLCNKFELSSTKHLACVPLQEQSKSASSRVERFSCSRVHVKENPCLCKLHAHRSCSWITETWPTERHVRWRRNMFRGGKHCVSFRLEFTWGHLEVILILRSVVILTCIVSCIMHPDWGTQMLVLCPRCTTFCLHYCRCSWVVLWLQVHRFQRGEGGGKLLLLKLVCLMMHSRNCQCNFMSNEFLTEVWLSSCSSCYEYIWCILHIVYVICNIIWNLL
jgi:hypothetical protein